MNYVFSKSGPVYAHKHSFFFGDECSSIMREELSRFMSFATSPIQGPYFTANPQQSHRHTIQFQASSYVQKKRLWKQAPVIMRQELEGGRKQASPSGSTGSRRLRSASCLSCEISIYIVARNTKTWTCKGLAEWGVVRPLRRPADWQLYFYRLLQTATDWTLTQSSVLAAAFVPSGRPGFKTARRCVCWWAEVKMFLC